MQYTNKLMREQSLLEAVKLGFRINETLPLLDADGQGRLLEQVVLRLLCMHVTAACAFGFDRTMAKDWIQKENLSYEMTSSERRFVELGLGDTSRFKWRIEGMWALAWAMGLVPKLDFAKKCDNNFVALLPDLTVLQSSEVLRSKVVMQPVDAQLAACDLGYCLHWSIRQAELSKAKMPGDIAPYVIVERRRALEWLISSQQWDEVSLDT